MIDLKSQCRAILLILLGSWLAFSCARSVNTTGEKYLLSGQAFRGNKLITAPELLGLLPQKPNKTLFGIPGFTTALWLYQWGEKGFDRQAQQTKWDSLDARYQRLFLEVAAQPKKLEKIRKKYLKDAEKYQKKIGEGNFWMRLGEAPVFFSEYETKKNQDKIRQYLFNHGFFNAKVNYNADTVAGKVRVVYNIDENLPYHYQNVNLQTGRDTKIDSLLKDHRAESFITAGERYSQDKLEGEQVRIEQLLQNNGYYGFSRQYLKKVLSKSGRVDGGFVLDTAATANRRDSLRQVVLDTTQRPIDLLKIDILLPRFLQAHPKFTYERVDFVVEAAPADSLMPKIKSDTIRYQGVNYYFSGKRYAPKILDSRIFIRPDSLYRLNNRNKTSLLLGNLQQFSYVNIDNDTVGSKIRSLIRVVPLPKYGVTLESGLNVVQSSTPGPFLNLSFQVRNIFRGMESFEQSVRFALDAQPGLTSQSGLFPTTELGTNSSLIFPQILLPTRFRNRFNAFNPRTQVSVGFNYVQRPEYTRTNLRAGLTYIWQKSQYESFNFSLLDFNYLRNQKIDSVNFLVELQNLQQNQGIQLIRSFQPSFVSSISFNYLFNNKLPSENRAARYFRLFAESGGTTLNLFSQQKLVNDILGQEIQLYKYVKAIADYRIYRPLGRNSSVNLRVSAGAIISYGNGEQSVPPYEKYFFLGGSSGMRAWAPRRLGPGSSPPTVSSRGFVIEAPGDLMIESSLELRGRLFHLVGDINYALFVDVGNVWTLYKNPTRPGSNFEGDRFWREMAVGSGFGLRYDFSFFILRFDFGIKIFDPSQAKPYVLDRFQFTFRPDAPYRLTPQIGIGYPF